MDRYAITMPADLGGGYTATKQSRSSKADDPAIQR
jgi:hypothetical protein